MALFYKRVETSTEIRILFNKWLFYVTACLLILLIISLALGSSLYTLIAGIFILFVGVVFVDTWKPNKEIRKALKTSGVYIKGSYFSFSNPISITIEKQH
jgi:L-lactate permease